MENGQATTMEALQLAIELEREGKAFYEEAGRKSDNRLTRELLQHLAQDEDLHRRKFEQIYRTLRKGQAWPNVDPPAGAARRLRPVLDQVTGELGSRIQVAGSELEVLRAAMDMESKSYELYRSRSDKSALPAEKRFYKALAAEERGHHLALLDSYEYLSDPAGWFSKRERWSLDGG